MRGRSARFFSDSAAARSASPAAGLSAARRSHSAAVEREWALRAAGHVDGHDFGVVAVVLRVGPAEDDGDRLSVRRNLRIVGVHDAQPVAGLPAIGADDGGHEEEGKGESLHGGESRTGMLNVQC